MSTIIIRDESAGGSILHEQHVEVLTERITVRELLRSRVYQEVQDWNRRSPAVDKARIPPTAAEHSLNNSGGKKVRQIDWHEQFAHALEAFASNRVIVLVDDQQVDSLDHEITVAPDTVVSFLRLMPLVGG